MSPAASNPVALNPLAVENGALLALIADAANHEITTVNGLAQRLDRDPSNLRKSLKVLTGQGLINEDPLTNGLTPDGQAQLDAIRRAEGGETADVVKPGDLVRLHPTQLRPDPANPRRVFTEAELEDLAASIAERGVQQSLRIRPLSPLPPTDDAYPGQAHQIISGERRWRASMKVLAAGEWPEGQTIPCIIASPEDEAEALEDALAENMVRQDLNHMEMAEGFEKLAQAGRENADIARAVGKSVGFVQQHRRLIRLAPDQQRAVATGTLSLHEALRILSGKPAAEPETETDPDQLPLLEEPDRNADAADEAESDPWLANGWALAKTYEVPITAQAASYAHRPKLSLYFVDAVEGPLQVRRYRARATVNLGGGHVLESTRIPGCSTIDGAIQLATEDLLYARPDMAPDFLIWLDSLTGPFVVGGRNCHNAARAGERRFAIGWDKRQSNSGGGAAAKPTAGETGAAAPDADTNPLDAVSPAAFLLAYELAHKIADARAFLSPTEDASWSGAASDYAAFGAPIGTYWTDAAFRELQAAGLVRAVTLPGGTPPLGALTDDGIAAFVTGGIPLPPSMEQLERRQRGEGRDPAPHRYLSPLLVNEVRPPAALQTAPDAGRIQGDLDADPWDRTPDQIEADRVRLHSVKVAVEQGDSELLDAAHFVALGVSGARHNTDGWVELVAADGSVLTEITVDQHNALPDERVMALEILISRAIARVMTGGEA